jgi:hypothetical protein
MPGLHLALSLKARDCMRRFENAIDWCSAGISARADILGSLAGHPPPELTQLGSASNCGINMPGVINARKSAVQQMGDMAV